MKLCLNCRHFRPFPHTPDDGDCRNPDVVWVHPVSGAPRYPSAFSQRISPSATSCGPSAQHWDYDPGSPPEPDESDDVDF